MKLYRDNPSNSEKKRTLTPKEIRKYRRMMLVGLYGLISVFGVLIAFILDWIPLKGYYQVWAFSYMLIGFVIHSVLFVTGLTKGQDRRPSIIEMLAAGGRR